MIIETWEFVKTDKLGDPIYLGINVLKSDPINSHEPIGFICDWGRLATLFLRFSSKNRESD